ncbi:MAG: hypothetical protein KGQ60_04525 [Planctomycetes bacterium]|nr:hypothetical protein [Planctomycetota bacterium]
MFPLVTLAESDSLDGQWAIEGVGQDTVIGLEIADEGLDGAGRVCGPLIVVGHERFDLLEREVSQVRLVEPIDGDAAVFDTIPPKLCLSSWCNFPIVGHGGFWAGWRSHREYASLDMDFTMRDLRRVYAEYR